MFAQSHLFLAKAIVEKLPDNLPYRLPMDAFYFGAVYPDMSPRYKKIKHKREAALPVVKELIQSVESVSDCQVLSRKQTFEMGIICHFLCDFFCQAHNFQEYSDLSKHLRYEMRMDRLISQELKDPSFQMVSCEAFHETQEVTDMVENVHDQYLDAPRGLTTDLSYAVTCSNAAMGILLQYLQANSYGSMPQPKLIPLWPIPAHAS